jgi:hypothetical protein
MRVTYRVLPRKDRRTCDVHATEDGKTRVINTFNSKADAWAWVNGAGAGSRDLRAPWEGRPQQALSMGSPIQRWQKIRPINRRNWTKVRDTCAK